MFTLDQKVDLIMRYIATADKTHRAELKKAVIQMLQDEDSEADNAPNIDIMIEDLLKEVGMPPHLLGYRATCHALHIIMNEPDRLKDLHKILYTDIGSLMGSTSDRVDRNIRHAVETTFDRGDPDVLRDLFGNTVSCYRGKLTNMEFLASCEMLLRRRLNSGR